MPTLLLVCTGNLCRSPMGMGLLRARLAEDPDRRDWTVLSAGVWAVEGEPATPEAVAVMAERGVDITDHRSRPITEALMREADLVLGMTPHHVEALRTTFPWAEERTHLLAEMAGESHGIADPYGQARHVYRSTARELSRIINAGYRRITHLAEKK